MRISDWSSDVCSSDLLVRRLAIPADAARQRHKRFARARLGGQVDDAAAEFAGKIRRIAFLNEGRIDDVGRKDVERDDALQRLGAGQRRAVEQRERIAVARSEEHTSELQSLMRISYAVFCLKKKIKMKYLVPRQQNHK